MRIVIEVLSNDAKSLFVNARGFISGYSNVLAMVTIATSDKRIKTFASYREACLWAYQYCSSVTWTVVSIPECEATK